MDVTNNKMSAFSYFILGMIAFGFLGLEFGVLFISTFVDGRSLSQVGSWPIHWYGAIFHWTMTIILWSIGSLLIWSWVKKKGIQKSLINVKMTKKTLYYTVVSIFIVIIYTLIESLISDTTIPQVISEYRGFVRMYGDYAWIVTIFQVLYYAFEMILVLLMIIMFQRMGEQLFKNQYIPYGSILLMLTWGMIHFLSHPAGALGVTIWAFMPGLIYIFSKKKFLPVYMLLLLGFIL